MIDRRAWLRGAAACAVDATRLARIARVRALALAPLAAITGASPRAARAERAASGHAARTSYAQRAEVGAFLDQLALARGLPRAWLDAVAAQGRYCHDAERLTTPGAAPTAPRDWPSFRSRHLDARRIAGGVAFWREHAAMLERIEPAFGVAPQYVVAILGIESRFGRLTGAYRALDVLLTLTFDYPRRAPMYRDELADFLVLCRDRGWYPAAVRSSFAGALGLPQFMPSSVLRYAVDFDNDRIVDLHRSVADAAGSIANYLALHGWRRAEAVAFEADPGSVSQATASALAGDTLATDARWDDLAARGVTIDGELRPDTPVMLVALPFDDGRGAQGTGYRVGTANFAALLQYNRSYFYAAAIVDLAAAIAAAT